MSLFKSIRGRVWYIYFIFNHPLNKHRQWQSIINYFRWHIGSRILGLPVAIKWIDDCAFFSSQGEYGLIGNFHYGLYELEEMGFLLHALKAEFQFVDIGANVGSYTLIASKIIGAKTICFEPVPSTVDRLSLNLRLNGIEDLVTIRRKALGDRIGSIKFTQNNDTMNQVVMGVEDQLQGLTVEMGVIDHEISFNGPLIFKIDIEGYEYPTLVGGRQVLSGNNVIAVIIEMNGSGNSYGYTNEMIDEELRSLGFFGIRYDPFLKKLSILTTYNKENQNTIYIKDFEKVKSYCEESKTHLIHTVSKEL